MPGIYSIFEAAAKGAEMIPWRTKLLTGMAVGAGVEAVYGDPDEDIMSRIEKGLFVGGITGLVAGHVIRGAGVVTSGVGKGAKWFAGSTFRKIGPEYSAAKEAFMLKNEGAKAWRGHATGAAKVLTSPRILPFVGAAMGAALAPQGYGLTGAAVGAGLGLFGPPLYKTYKGFEAAGSIPGAQTGLLLAAAAIPLGAQAMFGEGNPETQAVGTYSQPGVIDYTPLNSGMQDRMIAMNASGDLVLGLHGRSHG